MSNIKMNNKKAVPTIVVGCGGSGLATIQKLNRMLASNPALADRMGDEMFYLAIDTDTFTHIHKMGRGVESDAIACLLEDAGQRVAHASFAVRTCHMDGLVLTVRVTEMLVESQRVRQPFLIGTLPLVLEQGGAGVEIIKYLCVRH